MLILTLLTLAILLTALTLSAAPAEQTIGVPAITVRQGTNGLYYIFCYERCDVLTITPVNLLYQGFATSTDAINFYNTSIEPTFPW